MHINVCCLNPTLSINDSFMSSDIKKWLYATRTVGCPPSLLPQWFSSGSWQIGGIMNSDMLGECGCKHMPLFFFFLLFKCLYASYNSGSPSSLPPPPAVPWTVDIHPQKLWVSTTKQTGLRTSSFEAPGDFSAFVWSERLSFFRHIFLYLLIHRRLSEALMLVMAALSWFCHQRSSKGAVQSLWWGLQGFRKTPVARWEDVNQPKVHKDDCLSSIWRHPCNKTLVH